MDKLHSETVDPAWKGLYKVGGAASLVIALIYLLTTAVYVSAMRRAPAPGTVTEWFTLLENNPVVGLFYLGIADIIIVILFGPVSLALRVALEQVSRTWTTIATPLAFVGMAIYLATNTAFSMLSLSSEYAAAATEAQRSAVLAAGQAIISISRGTGSAAGLSLVWLTSLIFSILMLRSRMFGKTVAWVGNLSFYASCTKLSVCRIHIWGINRHQGHTGYCHKPRRWIAFSGVVHPGWLRTAKKRSFLRQDDFRSITEMPAAGRRPEPLGGQALPLPGCRAERPDPDRLCPARLAGLHRAPQAKPDLAWCSNSQSRRAALRRDPAGCAWL